MVHRRSVWRTTLAAIVTATTALALAPATNANASSPPSCITWKNESNPPGFKTITVQSECAYWTRVKIVMPWYPDSSCVDLKPLTTKTFPNYSPRPFSSNASVESC